jgi:hypothetical protein
MQSLAPEIILSIASHLYGQHLRQLCLVDRRTNALVVPLLYNSIRVTRLDSLSLLYRTVNSNRSSFGTMIQELVIGISDQDDHFWSDRDVSQLRRIFSMLPRLQVLGLDIAIPISDIFCGLDVQFRLRSLEAHLTLGLGLFLISQPLINSLVLLGRTDSSEIDRFVELSKSPELLPFLNRMSADLWSLKLLMPGRPITTVGVLPTPLEFSFDQSICELAAALNETCKPLVSITYTSREEVCGFDPSVWRFLYHLVNTTVPSTLRSLTIEHRSMVSLVALCV